MTPKKLGAETFDRFLGERKEDIVEYLDLDSAEVIHVAREARHVAVSRRAVLKTWLAERLDEEARRTG